MFLFKQKTAYDLRISDWMSDVCSSDLVDAVLRQPGGQRRADHRIGKARRYAEKKGPQRRLLHIGLHRVQPASRALRHVGHKSVRPPGMIIRATIWANAVEASRPPILRSEEHTSELQSLMRTSYAVFCLKKKNYLIPQNNV